MYVYLLSYVYMCVCKVFINVSFYILCVGIYPPPAPHRSAAYIMTMVKSSPPPTCIQKKENTQFFSPQILCLVIMFSIGFEFSKQAYNMKTALPQREQTNKIK